MLNLSKQFLHNLSQEYFVLSIWYVHGIHVYIQSIKYIMQQPLRLAFISIA